MAKSKGTRTPKGKGKDAGRKFKKKVSPLTTEQVEYVDWKDVNLLRRFISDRAKVRARRVTGNDVQQQREVARAIKNAREMALIPYSNRVTTQRGNRGRDRDRDRDRGGEDRRDRRERSEESSAPSTGSEEFTALPEGTTEAAAAPTGAEQ